MENFKDKYESVEKNRDGFLDAILASKAKKKVVVAGPGTGKTFLFKKILNSVGSTNTLTLTFVNSLVEDLSLDLYKMTDVKTLHSYARGMLNKITKKDIKISPLLSSIIKEDALILIKENVDFDKIFFNLEDKKELISFYKKRHEYYGYYGYSDVIYALIKCLEKYRDKIPSYEQILIDEFQDFNLLEVTLIDLLSSKSPILLAGDDDQALYDFKNASTKHIRERFCIENTEYESFTLPYCARCPRVIVDAANDIIRQAKNSSLLQDRIEKDYLYFECQNKDKVSDQYPSISYTNRFDSQIPWFIATKIDKMAEDTKGNFSVLVISPYKKQISAISESLKAKGYKNIECKIQTEKEITLYDGIKMLLEDKEDNLGWRIVCKHLLTDEEFGKLINETDKQPDKKVLELIDITHRKKGKQLRKIINKIKEQAEISDDELISFFDDVKIDSKKITKEYIIDDLAKDNNKAGNPATRKIPIKATTIQSSKGLSADLVFITHFDDQYFIKNHENNSITDQDVCSFLVALSRAKKKVYLISSHEQKPTFFNWISNERIEYV